MFSKSIQVSLIAASAVETYAARSKSVPANAAVNKRDRRAARTQHRSSSPAARQRSRSGIHHSSSNARVSSLERTFSDVSFRSRPTSRSPSRDPSMYSVDSKSSTTDTLHPTQKKTERNISVVVDLQADYCSDCDTGHMIKPGPFQVHRPLEVDPTHHMATSDWLRGSKFNALSQKCAKFMRQMDAEKDLLLLSKDNLTGNDLKCAVRKEWTDDTKNGCMEGFNAASQTKFMGNNPFLKPENCAEGACNPNCGAKDNKNCQYHKKFWMGVPDWRKPVMYYEVHGSSLKPFEKSFKTKNQSGGLNLSKLKCSVTVGWNGKPMEEDEPCEGFDDLVAWLRTGGRKWVRGADAKGSRGKWEKEQKDLIAQTPPMHGESLVDYLNKLNIRPTCDHYVWNYGPENVQEILNPNSPNGHNYMPAIQEVASNYQGAVAYTGKVINSWLNEGNAWWTEESVEATRLKEEGKDKGVLSSFQRDMFNEQCTVPRIDYKNLSAKEANDKNIERYTNLQCIGGAANREKLQKNMDLKIAHSKKSILTEKGGLKTWCPAGEKCNFWVFGLSFERCVQAGSMDTMKYKYLDTKQNKNSFGEIDIRIMLDLTNFKDMNIENTDMNRSKDTAWVWETDAAKRFKKAELLAFQKDRFVLTKDAFLECSIHLNIYKVRGEVFERLYKKDTATQFHVRTSDGEEGLIDRLKLTKSKIHEDKTDTQGKEYSVRNRLIELALAGVKLVQTPSDSLMPKDIKKQKNLADLSDYDYDMEKYLQTMAQLMEEAKKTQ